MIVMSPMREYQLAAENEYQTKSRQDMYRQIAHCWRRIDRLNKQAAEKSSDDGEMQAAALSEIDR